MSCLNASGLVYMPEGTGVGRERGKAPYSGPGRISIHFLPFSLPFRVLGSVHANLTSFSPGPGPDDGSHVGSSSLHTTCNYCAAGPAREGSFKVCKILKFARNDNILMHIWLNVLVPEIAKKA